MKRRAESLGRRGQEGGYGGDAPIIDTHTLNPNAARLAENENAFIDSLHESDDHHKRKELAEWIGGILGEYLNPTTLFRDLNNGVRLLYLAKSIHLIKCAHLKDSEYREAIRNLQPDEVTLTDHQSHKRASHIAKQRSNILKFLEWCRHIGVPPITLFETEDLAREKNLHQVTTCLFYVSRIASRFGIEPPSSVKEEMENEGAKLLGKKIEETFASSKRRSPSADTNRLLVNKAPIYEIDEEENGPARDKRVKQVSLFRDNFGQTSTPSPVSRLHDIGKPISPKNLKFEDLEADAVVVETLPNRQKTQIHFDRKPFVEDVEITEIHDMVIVDQLQFHPIDVPVDHEVTKLDDGTEVKVSPAPPDMNENTELAASDSTFESTSSSENEYHTAQDTITRDDITGLMYHTAFVDDVSDDDDEDTRARLETLGKMEEPVDVPVTSPEDIPDINDMLVTYPHSLYRVPADIVVERHEMNENGDESTADVESYSSSDSEHGITFADVGVGTEDLFLTSEQKEIMIDFPPYFEIARRRESRKMPPVEYMVAPVVNEPIYSKPKSSTRERSSRTNAAYQADEEPNPRPSREYVPIEPRHPRRYREAGYAAQPIPSARNLYDDVTNDKGTQTHVSLTQDIVRIINEMEDIPRIRTPSTSASSRQASPGPISYGGTTVVVRAQYQQTLPTGDREVAAVQTQDLESARPPRVGSVAGSTRYKSRDVEAASVNKEVRRSFVRRASSLISEQFEKSAVVVKKYRKHVAVVAVLLILTVGLLAALLAIFPLT